MSTETKLAWQRILSEGHVWTARLNDQLAASPVVAKLKYVPLVIGAIGVAAFMGGGAAVVSAYKGVDATITKLSETGKVESQNINTRENDKALDSVLARQMMPHSGIVDATTGNPKTVQITPEILDSVVADQLVAASKGELSTTWKGGPLPEDGIEVIKTKEAVFLFAKVARGNSTDLAVVILRKTDGEWKAFALTYGPRFVVPSKATAITPEKIPVAINGLILEMRNILTKGK